MFEWRAWTTGLLLAMVVAGLVACSSAKPGGSWLYEKGEGGRLLDSEIRIETQRKTRGDRLMDVRRIRCKDGNITGSVVAPRQKLRGEGRVSFDDYAAIWERYHNSGWGLNVEPLDPSGGYYHIVTMRLGGHSHEFSAQQRTNFLGVATQDIATRLELVSDVVRLLDDVVKLEPYEPEEEGKSVEEKKPSQGN